MIFFFSKTKGIPPTKEPERYPNEVMLYANDDLVQRAEKIVYLLGYRGAVGNYVFDVYKTLKLYKELDEEALNITKAAESPVEVTENSKSQASGSDSHRSHQDIKQEQQ